MKLIFNIIAVVFLFAPSLLAIHFSDQVTLQQIRVVETERLRVSLFLKYQDSPSVKKLYQQNIDRHYLEPFFNGSVELHDYAVKNYVQQYFDENKKMLESLTGELIIKSSIQSMNYLISVKDSDEVIGMMEVNGIIGLELALGIFIAQAHTKKGYATEAVLGVLNMLEQKSQMVCCTWRCWQDNIASRRVAERCQFEWVEDCLQENGPMVSIFRKKLGH